MVVVYSIFMRDRCRMTIDPDRGAGGAGGGCSFMLELIGYVHMLVGVLLLFCGCSFLLGLCPLYIVVPVLSCVRVFVVCALQELAALQDETELKASAAREGLAAADAQTVAAADESNRLR